MYDARGAARSRLVPRARPGDVTREMALAGITRVGEFHYLHHDPAATPYADPNAMGEALIAAADEAGIRDHAARRLLPRTAASGEPLEGAQRRFSDGDADGVGRAGRRGSMASATRASAPRSTRVRAVTRGRCAIVAAGRGAQRAAARPRLRAARRERGVPRRLRLTPTRLLDEPARSASAFTAVHATHLDRRRLASSWRGTDDVLHVPDDRARPRRRHRPGRRCATRASTCARARDSNAVIDLFEEARAVELDERLATGDARHAPRAGAAARRRPPTATRRSAGPTPAGSSRRAGRPRHRRPRLGPPRGRRADDAVESLVFAATAADVTRRRSSAAARSSRDGATLDRRRRASSTTRSQGGGAVTALVDRRHRPARHERPELGRGAARRCVRDAAVVVDGGRVAAIEPPGRPPTSGIDAGGRCVIPGLRRQPHPPRLRRRPRGGVRGPDGGRRRTPPAASATTVEATRAATDEELGAHARPRRSREALRAGTRTVEIKSGYGLDVATRHGACAIAAPRSPTSRRSSAPTSCRPSTRDGRTTTSTWSAARCSTPARRTRAGSTSSASSGAFDADQSPRGARGRAAPPDSALRVHANQLGHGPGVQLAVELGAPRPTTAPTSPTTTSRRSPASDTVATFLPATDFSHPPALPRRAPRDRRRRHRRARHATATPARATRRSMPFCIALAVREWHDHRRGGAAATSAAPGPCAATTSAVSARVPRRPVVLDAPRTSTSPTGPASRSSPGLRRGSFRRTPCPDPSDGFQRGVRTIITEVREGAVGLPLVGDPEDREDDGADEPVSSLTPTRTLRRARGRRPGPGRRTAEATGTATAPPAPLDDRHRDRSTPRETREPDAAGHDPDPAVGRASAPPIAYGIPKIAAATPTAITTSRRFRPSRARPSGRRTSGSPRA